MEPSTPKPTPKLTDISTPKSTVAKPTEAEKQSFIEEYDRSYKSKNWPAVVDHVISGFSGKFKENTELYDKIRKNFEFACSLATGYYTGEEKLHEAITMHETVMELFDDLDFSACLEHLCRLVFEMYIPNQSVMIS